MQNPLIIIQLLYWCSLVLHNMYLMQSIKRVVVLIQNFFLQNISIACPVFGGFVVFVLFLFLFFYIMSDLFIYK